MMTDALLTANPTPNTDDAIKFLEMFAPTDHWVLAAIRPEGGGPEVKTFGVDAADDARAWIDSHNGKRNLYFQVNPPLHNLSKKASKKDIKSLDWLHVDVDPRAGEDIVSEGKRILALFSENRPESVPEPTIVIFSGGGYQAFWRLQESVPIDGDLEKAVEAERYNKKLEDLFGADSCHNVDRIMRLPGTINLPNEKKRNRGRKPALARLISFNSDLSYDACQFEKSSQTVSVKAEQDGVPTPDFELAEISPRLIDSVDDLLDWNVSERCRMMIVHGKDPMDPNRYPSRSESMFAVLAELLRKEVPDDIIMGVLLNAKLGISNSIFEKGTDSFAYAVRQLKRAKIAVKASWREVNNGGEPKASYSNARIAIQKLNIACELNCFSDRKLIGGHLIENVAGELSDDACACLRQLIIDKFGFDPGKTNVQDAANGLCIENQFDPVCSYLNTFVWDGVPRIDTFLTTFCGADNTQLNREISKILFVAAVRRARVPGCKFDNIVVLEGKQGSGKSSALAILAGNDVFSDAEIIHMDSRAQQEQIKGVWIFEIGELAGLRKVDIEKVKAFASRTHDRARPAYGRFSIDAPRRCIFVGTTNESEYLRDPTGNRRFWPVATREIDLVGIAQNRDQLWAEAAHWEANGASVTLPPELWEDAGVQQEARREDDPWLDVLSKVSGIVVQNEYRISTTQIMTNHLELAVDRQLPHVSKRIADCMRRLGWEGPQKMRICGESVRGFRRPSVNGDAENEPEHLQDPVSENEVPF